MSEMEWNTTIGDVPQQNISLPRPLNANDKKLNHYKGLGMVLLGAVLWGISGSAAQILFQHEGISSGWLVTVRMSLAGLLMLIGMSLKLGLGSIFLIWKEKKDVLKLLVFGIVGLLGVQYSYFAAIKYGNAATGTILQYMGPIFIMVYIALREMRLPSISQLISGGLAIFGAFLLVTNGDIHQFSISPLAVIWGGVSAATLAFYSLYPQSLLRKYGAAIVSGWGMLIGGVGMSFIHPPWKISGQFSFETWGLVSFVVLFGTLIAFYVYMASLKYISAAEASILSCGEPLSATVIAVVFLHVHMGWQALFGGVCILVTVTLMASRSPAND